MSFLSGEIICHPCPEVFLVHIPLLVIFSINTYISHVNKAIHNFIIVYYCKCCISLGNLFYECFINEILYLCCFYAICVVSTQSLMFLHNL